MQNPYFSDRTDVYDSSIKVTASKAVTWDTPPAPGFSLDQNFIPLIVRDTGNICGYVFLASTVTFDGTETSIVAGSMTFNIGVATMPQHFGEPGFPPVDQFMAAYLTHTEEVQEVWRGCTTWQANLTDTYSFWRYSGMKYRRGAIYRALTYGYFVLEAPIPVTPEPVPQDGALTWSAGLNLADAGSECMFFDFPWIEVFQTSRAGDKAVPKYIEVLTNPSGGEFKATLANAPGAAVLTPAGGYIQDTIRILRMKDVVAGDYEFVFRITDSKAVVTTVTLTLTVA